MYVSESGAHAQAQAHTLAATCPCMQTRACIEVALRGSAHGIGRPTVPGGRGPSIVGPISQRRGTINTASRTLDHTHAHMCVF